jgi:hypothetical protein
MTNFFKFIKENAIIILLLLIVILNLRTSFVETHNKEEIEDIQHHLDKQKIINEKVLILNDRIKELEKKK